MNDNCTAYRLQISGGVICDRQRQTDSSLLDIRQNMKQTKRTREINHLMRQSHVLYVS